MYILAPNTYPYSDGQLRTDNPQVSFPVALSDAVREAFGVYPVAPVEPPSYAPATEDLLEGTPVLIDGTWTQTWTVRTLAPEEIEARRKATVPPVVSMRQARLALLAAGLLDDVEAAIAAGSQAARIEWEYAAEVARDYGLVLQLAPALGLTDRQLDDLFVVAASL